MNLKHATLAAAIAALAACSGDQPAPLQPPPAQLDLGTLEECQDQGPIKRLIASVFPAGTISDAQTRFAAINRTYCVRSVDDAGRAQMYALVSLIATKYSTGALNPVPLSPDGNPVPATLADAVYQLIARAGMADSAKRVLERARVGRDVDPRAELAGYEAFARVIAGDNDGALELLKQYLTANPEHRTGFAKLQTWLWRPLKGDPRYIELVGNGS